MLLFPTIEQLAETPQGKSVSYLLRSSFFRWFIVFLASILSITTTRRMRAGFIRWYFGADVHPSVVRATETLLLPAVMGQVLHMAMTEMEQVTELDDELWGTVADNSAKTVLYYGRNDHWCPMALYGAMRGRFERCGLSVDAVRLDEEQVEHAFVIRHSDVMARVCAAMM